MTQIAITVKQPFAYLICAGIKDVENRSWKLPEKYKGKRVLIHAGADRGFEKGIFSNYFTDEQKRIYIRTKIKRMMLPDYDNIYSAIIGSVEIVDCVKNHPSVWAEHWATKPWHNGVRGGFYDIECYNWILANPILFDKPIENVKGKLGFWKYENK